MPRALGFGLLMAACMLGALRLPAQDRVALVIGNANYDGEAALTNPANDAEAIAASLVKLDFKVTKHIDLDLTQLEAAVVQFRRSLKKGDLAFFFFAGHGVQVKGENFLVPLKANLEEEFQVKEKCYKLDQVLEALDSSEASLKVVVLDACRNNPLARSWSRDASKKGLAKVNDLPEGTLVAFSTASGATAADAAIGNRRNSPYTHQLVTVLNSRPPDGLELREVFFDASAAVKEQSGQVPWLNMDATIRKYYLWRDDGRSLVNGVGMKMILVTPGKFTMGSPADEPGFFKDQGQARVELTKTYYLGRTEVTQGQWKAVMSTEPWKGKEYVTEGADFPAVYVNWNEATEFCKRLSAKEGRTYRLPTEAEWEHACRGGTTQAYCYGADATKLGDHAWFDENAWKAGKKSAQPVGQKKANPLGLCDMHGNVWEWCQDIYLVKQSGGRDPVIIAGGDRRSTRGGGWDTTAAGCRSASRGNDEPTYRHDRLGFRVALNAEGK